MPHPHSFRIPYLGPGKGPDLHLNIHQFVTSSNNSTQLAIKVPDEFSARAERYIKCYGICLSRLSLDFLSRSSLSTFSLDFLSRHSLSIFSLDFLDDRRRQNGTIEDDVKFRPLFKRHLFEISKNSKINPKILCCDVMMALLEDSVCRGVLRSGVL